MKAIHPQEQQTTIRVIAVVAHSVHEFAFSARHSTASGPEAVMRAVSAPKDSVLVCRVPQAVSLVRAVTVRAIITPMATSPVKKVTSPVKKAINPVRAVISLARAVIVRAITSRRVRAAISRAETISHVRTTIVRVIIRKVKRVAISSVPVVISPVRAVISSVPVAISPVRAAISSVPVATSPVKAVISSDPVAIRNVKAAISRVATVSVRPATIRMRNTA